MVLSDPGEGGLIRHPLELPCPPGCEAPLCTDLRVLTAPAHFYTPTFTKKPKIELFT